MQEQFCAGAATAQTRCRSFLPPPQCRPDAPLHLTTIIHKPPFHPVSPTPCPFCHPPAWVSCGGRLGFLGAGTCWNYASSSQCLWLLG
eukprot:6977560-Karenia_brevis.AAC.1